MNGVFKWTNIPTAKAKYTLGWEPSWDLLPSHLEMPVGTYCISFRDKNFQVENYMKVWGNVGAHD